ncbi:MAG: PfkB family carbohydrate kinase [Chloroflexota bacterium]|nr:PfkB family carbohydrate kinase [Chloroflexota bacterium]
MKLEMAKTNGHRPRVVGTGLLAADVLLDFRKPKVGRLNAGGTCGNVLTILGALGWTSRPVARLGVDVAGKVIQRDMEAWGVELSLIVEAPSSRSPVYFHWLMGQESGPRVHRFSRECPECGTVLPGFQPVPQAIVQTLVEDLGEVDVFFADRVSRGAITLARLCRDRGAMVVFEPSGGTDPQLFSEMLALSHVVKYSNERGKKVVPLISVAEGLSCLVIETMGSKGLRYQVVEGRLARNGWRVLEPVVTDEVRDTAGAGDWCTAGFLHTIGQHGFGRFREAPREALEQSLMAGQHVAAWSCAFEGARGGMYVPEEHGGFKQTLLDGIGLRDSSKPNQLELDSTCRATSDICPACPPTDPHVGRLCHQGSE